MLLFPLPSPRQVVHWMTHELSAQVLEAVRIRPAQKSRSEEDFPNDAVRPQPSKATFRRPVGAKDG